MGTAWTDSDRLTLSQLWPTETVSVIGKLMGRSRNSIIGQAHRLKLEAKGPTGIVRRKPEQIHQNYRPRPVVVRKAPELAPEPIRQPQPYAGPIPLVDSLGCHCKAIIEDIKDGDGLAMVCGKPIVEGQAFSFCSEHLLRYTQRGYGR